MYCYSISMSEDIQKFKQHTMFKTLIGNPKSWTLIEKTNEVKKIVSENSNQQPLPKENLKIRET